jgi:hypothetical protein
LHTGQQRSTFQESVAWALPHEAGVLQVSAAQGRGPVQTSIRSTDNDLPTPLQVPEPVLHSDLTQSLQLGGLTVCSVIWAGGPWELRFLLEQLQNGCFSNYFLGSFENHSI